MTEKERGLEEDVAAIIAPDQSVSGSDTIYVGGKVLVLETAKYYKVQECLRTVTKVLKTADMQTLAGGIVDAMSNPEGKTQMYYVGFLLHFLPTISEQGVDLLNDLAALFTLTNLELQEAYRKGNNAVKELVDAQKEWLLFECEPDEVIEIIEAYWPTLGLDTLKNVIMPMLKRIGAANTVKSQ